MENNNLQEWFSNDELFFKELSSGDQWTRYVAAKLNHRRNQVSCSRVQDSKACQRKTQVRQERKRHYS